MSDGTHVYYCTKRKKGKSCTAAIYVKSSDIDNVEIQNSDDDKIQITRNYPNKPNRITKHSCVPLVTDYEKILIEKQIKISKDIKITTPELVDKIMLDICNIKTNLPNRANIIRNANNCRKDNRPTITMNVNFILNEEYIPNKFLVADETDKIFGRVVLFATDQQIDILSQCEEIYVDGTFKVNYHNNI